MKSFTFYNLKEFSEDKVSFLKGKHHQKLSQWGQKQLSKSTSTSRKPTLKHFLNIRNTFVAISQTTLNLKAIIL